MTRTTKLKMAAGRLITLYAYNTMQFNVVDAPKKGVVTPGEYFFTCREAFLSSVHEYIEEGTRSCTPDLSRVVVCMNGMSRSGSFGEKMIKDPDRFVAGGVRLINAFEKAAAWKRTTMTKLIPPEKVLFRRGSFFYIEGSKMWSRSPQLLSLWLLLLRLGLNEEVADNAGMSIKSKMALLNKMATTPKGEKYRTQDVNDFIDAAELWLKFVRNTSKVLEGITNAQLWNDKSYNNWSIHLEGIDSLVNGDCQFTKLQNSFDKVVGRR